MDKEKNKNNLNGGKPLWAVGVEMFSQISVWIVLPIVGALILGKSLDAHYGTKPWIFLSLALVGFLITLFGIVRIVLKYIRQIEKDASRTKSRTQK